MKTIELIRINEMHKFTLQWLFSTSFVNKCIDFATEIVNNNFFLSFPFFFRIEGKLINEHPFEMKTANWILFTCYATLLLLFAIISTGQTAPQNRTETPNDTASADIFGTPRIAKRRCTMGKRWADGKCRTFVDWFLLDVYVIFQRKWVSFTEMIVC